MKRDPRLRGLSSEHHHALVLARSLEEAVASGRADAGTARDLAARFTMELGPHFAIEEELLLPALRAAGEAALVEQTEVDHAFLREQASAASLGRTAGLTSFAERLREHVRFEERALFPRCEELLSNDALDEVARRRP